MSAKRRRTDSNDLSREFLESSSTTGKTTEENTKQFEKSIQDCVAKAFTFSTKGIGSYTGARISAEDLCKSMERLDGGTMSTACRFLLSKHVISCLDVAINEVQFRNQIVDTNWNKDEPYSECRKNCLTHIVILALKWCRAKQCDRCCNGKACDCSNINATTCCKANYYCSKGQLLNSIQKNVIDAWKLRFAEQPAIDIDFISTPSPSQFEVSHKCTDNNSIQVCFDEAETFAASRNSSYADARDSIQRLLTSMAEVDRENNQTAIQLLLASHVGSCLNVVINGKQIWNTISVMNDHDQDKYYLSEVVVLALKWCLSKSCDIISDCSANENMDCILHNKLCCQTNVLKQILSVVDSWNRKFLNRPKISIASYPPPTFSQSGHWLQFTRIPTEQLSVTSTIQFNFNTRKLKHATSTANALEIIKGLLNSKDSIKLVGKPKVFGSVPLVWCGIELNEEELSKIPPQSRGYAKDNRYGGVVLEFCISATRLRNNGRAFVFGTRKYKYEYSQALLIPESNSAPHFHTYTHNEGVHEMEEIDLKTYSWDLDYSTSGDWTHPELAFAGELEIPVESLKIYFSDHQCISYRKNDCADGCRDGYIKRANTTEAKFIYMINQIAGLKLVENPGTDRYFTVYCQST